MTRLRNRRQKVNDGRSSLALFSVLAIRIAALRSFLEKGRVRWNLTWDGDKMKTGGKGDFSAKFCFFLNGLAAAGRIASEAGNGGQKTGDTAMKKILPGMMAAGALAGEAGCGRGCMGGGARRYVDGGGVCDNCNGGARGGAGRGGCR